MSLLFLNVILALIWFFLADHPQPYHLVIGFILGFLMILVYREIFGEWRQAKQSKSKNFDYVRRVISLTKFIFWFVGAFLSANFKVAYTVLTLNADQLQPQLFEIDTTKLSTLEVIIVSQCITLTPGTTTVQVSDDENTVLVHALDGSDITAERNSIQNQLVPRILAFTRGVT